MASVICFGPNESYLFNSPTQWSYSNLPPALTALFTQQPKIQDVYELALGPTGAYVLIYRDAQGNIMLSHAGLPEDLRKWLIPVPGQGVVRDLASLNVSFNATGGWFAFDKNSSIRENLPPGFEAAVQQRMTPQGQWRNDGDFPENVSFGPNDAYCMVTRGGSACWNLNGQLPDLENFLSQSKSLKEVYPILSPYHANVHVTCFGNGHTWAAVPNHCLQQFKIFEADFKAACQRAAQQVHQQAQHRPVAVHHNTAPAGLGQPHIQPHTAAHTPPLTQVHSQPLPHAHAQPHTQAHPRPHAQTVAHAPVRPNAHPVQNAHHANSHHSKTETALGVMKNVNQGLKLVNGIMKIANGGSSGGDSGGGGGDSGGIFNFGGDSGGDSGGNNFWNN